MPRTLLFAFLMLTSFAAQAQRSYLFVWAGADDGKASDFLGVIDADPASPRYGAIVASIATGVAGTHPHHTDAEMPRNGHLLANGFHAGRTWLFDLREPLKPRILANFGDVAGFSHPHTFVRLDNGNVLVTFQYHASGAAGSSLAPMHHGAHTMAGSGSEARVQHTTGGLVEMDERGRLVRSGAAADPNIADPHIYPYSVLPLRRFDRAVSTTTDMDQDNKAATSEWVQFWRLSDLKLLRSIALAPGPRGDEHKFSGEPRLLADGRSIYIHTFNCGLYLLRGAETDKPAAQFVHGFEGTNCGVPLLAGRYWLQTVPDAHALVSLDISDAERPKEVSRVSLGADEQPHWIAIDAGGRRIVLNSGGAGDGNRLFVINLDPATGTLALDQRFRDPGSNRAGVRLTGKSWPHGFTGKAIPHGTVFSR